MPQIPVSMLEFVEGGNTIWVHGPNGATVLRIKTMGKIVADNKCTNICSHSDIVVKEDIHFCLTDDVLGGDDAFPECEEDQEGGCVDISNLNK